MFLTSCCLIVCSMQMLICPMSTLNVFVGYSIASTASIEDQCLPFIFVN